MISLYITKKIVANSIHVDIPRAIIQIIFQLYPMDSQNSVGIATNITTVVMNLMYSRTTVTCIPLYFLIHRKNLH